MSTPAAQPPDAFEAFQPPAPYNPFVDPDGLGVRTIGCDTFSSDLLDVLRLTHELSAQAGVEALVRERCTRFTPGALDGLAPIVRVQRAFDGRLELWSRPAPGFRLSVVLEWAEARGVAPPLAAALAIADRLLSAVTSLQAVEQAANAPGHGAIAVDQVVVSETGALALTDYALATALAALQWPRERLWRRLRIALPPAAGLWHFDRRVDVTQAAVVTASLLAGRRLRAEEYPRELGSMIREAVQRSCADAARADRDRLVAWLRAATELEPRAAFKSAQQAREALRDAFGARLDDMAAVGCWLRAARGVTDAVPERPRDRAAVTREVGPPQETAEPAQTLSAGSEPRTVQAAEPPSRTGLRRWLRFS